MKAILKSMCDSMSNSIKSPMRCTQS